MSGSYCPPTQPQERPGPQGLGLFLVLGNEMEDDLAAAMATIALRMDNDERERGLLLLRQIIDAGGTVRAYDNVDHRPYMRMQKQRWLTGRNLGDRVIYEVTEAGRQALLK
jgi:hypothetical protein